MGDGVVIAANTNGVETNYTYGLERISAQTGNRKTEYVYDGRGSVAAEVSYNNAWYTLGGAFSKKDVTSKSYTPFGEQIGEAVSGFGYNGEYYNAATGMVYLRARFYEPAMNRFSQKDIVRGSVTNPGSLNRYTYVQNDPINFIDPSGQSLKSFVSSAASKISNAAKSVATGVKNFFTGGSSSTAAPAAPSKPAASSTGSKTSATSANTAGTAAKKSTTSSATAYAGSSSGSNRVQSPGPVQSTAQNVNPYNVAQSTAQAVADARKAADYMNATAPGSPAAQQATRAYMETQRLASMANATHDPNIARQAVQASQASVNHTNNVATGRSPNTYSPYNSNGNATSYFNSSYQSGKAPSPDAPRIEDVTGDSVQYCSTADRIANIQAFGAGDYSGIANGINQFTELMKVFYNSLEIKAGVGQGFGGSVEIADIGADFEISGNYIEIRVDDGKWHFGQSSKAEASLDLIFADIGGRYIEYYDFNGNLLPNLDNSFSWYSLKLPNGVSASAYFIVGGSVSIEINYSDLMVNWEKYLEGLHE